MLVGSAGFEPTTYGYLQLQNFVIPRRVSIPVQVASGARRNTCLYYGPTTQTIFKNSYLKAEEPPTNTAATNNQRHM